MDVRGHLGKDWLDRGAWGSPPPERGTTGYQLTASCLGFVLNGASWAPFLPFVKEGAALGAEGTSHFLRYFYHKCGQDLRGGRRGGGATSQKFLHDLPFPLNHVGV